MSKQIKQMEMDTLKATFGEVRDLVLLSASGLDAQTDNQIRLRLRKKNIRLQVVKNSLAHRVFDEMGLKLADAWSGPTLVAWGAGSVAELARELDAVIGKTDKIKVKTGVAEGQEQPFPRLLSMPTRAEAHGRIVGLALSPASRLVGQLKGAAARVAGQIKTLAERAPAAEAAPAPAP
jgi:large subunit ribosomal protein L10